MTNWTNARPTGQEVAVVGEAQTIGQHETGRVLPHGLPLEESPSSVQVLRASNSAAFVEVAGAPAPNEFRVWYDPDQPLGGSLEFNAADAGVAVTVSYLSRGDLLWAHDLERFVERNEVGAAAAVLFSSRVTADAFDRVQIRSDGIAVGEGTAAPALSITRSLVNGLTLTGSAGSSYDFAVRDRAGVVVLYNIQNTRNFGFSGKLSVGTAPLEYVSAYIRGTLSGSATQRGILVDVTGGSDGTAGLYGVQSQVRTPVASYTVNIAAGFYASNPVVGAGSLINNFYGVYIDTLTGGTNNFSIYTGASPSRFGGTIAMGATPVAYYGAWVYNLLTGATTQVAVRAIARTSYEATANALGVYSRVEAQAHTGAYNITQLSAFFAPAPSLGTNATVTNIRQYHTDDVATAASGQVVGYYSALTSGANKWAFYGGGTAASYFGGAVTVVGDLTVSGAFTPSGGLSLPNGAYGFGASSLGSWASATYRVLQGLYGALAYHQTSRQLAMVANAYYDGAWRYLGTAGASAVTATDAGVNVQVVESGTAAASFTWSTMMAITTSGVGIGSGATSPAFPLDVRHSKQSDYVAYIHQLGNQGRGLVVSIDTPFDTNAIFEGRSDVGGDNVKKFEVNSGGGVWSANNSYTGSDKRYKENFRELGQDPMVYLRAFAGRYQLWNRKGQPDLTQFGYIAQDVEAAGFEWAVRRGADGYLALDNQALVSLALAGVYRVDSRLGNAERALRTLLEQNEDLAGREEALAFLSN